jgi:hypothetical protein
LAVSFLAFRFADPDVFWHLAAGEHILATGHLPCADTWSWSVPGAPWTDHEWAWQVLAALAYRALRLPGLALLTWAAATAAGSALVLALHRRGAEMDAAFSAAAFGVLLGIGWWRPWPQAGAYACFAAYLAVRRTSPAMLLLAAAWANLHASAVMLPFLLALEATWAWLQQGERPARRLGVASLALAGTLASPLGLGLWRYALKEGIFTATYRQVVQEWMPLDPHQPGQAIVAVLGAAVLIAALVRRAAGDIAFPRAAAFWVAAWLSRIYLPFALLSTALLMGALVPRIQVRTARGITAAIGLLVAALVGAALRDGLPMDLDTLARRCGYPVDAMEVIRARSLTRLHNPLGWGGYLLWKGVPVFIDGRNDLYRDILPAYLDRSSPTAYGAQAILAAEGDGWDAQAREEAWDEVWRGGGFVVWGRPPEAGDAEGE